jgi:hypothetical protein
MPALRGFLLAEFYRQIPGFVKFWLTPFNALDIKESIIP